MAPKNQRNYDAPLVLPPIGSTPKLPPPPAKPAQPAAPVAAPAAPRPPAAPAPTPQATPIGAAPAPTIGATGIAPAQQPANTGAPINLAPPTSRIAPGTTMQANPNAVGEEQRRAVAERVAGEQLEDLTPDGAEVRQDFARPTGGAGPSDFVSFSDFAGLNDDMMRDIADRAAVGSEQKRQAAAGLLTAAKGEANASTPLEKTASYTKYLEAIEGAGQGARAATARSENPYEDALRGIYAGAQNARENRLQTNAMKRGANAAKMSNAEYDAAAKAASESAAADASASSAAAAAATKEANAQGVAEAAEARREAIAARTPRGRTNKYGD